MPIISCSPCTISRVLHDWFVLRIITPWWNVAVGPNEMAEPEVLRTIRTTTAMAIHQQQRLVQVSVHFRPLTSTTRTPAQDGCLQSGADLYLEDDHRSPRDEGPPPRLTHRMSPFPIYHY